MQSAHIVFDPHSRFGFRAEDAKPKHYKLIFHYVSGEDYVANKVTEYHFPTDFFCENNTNSPKVWEQLEYHRAKNKFTTESCIVPLHDCIAIEVWDNDSGEVVVKRNPQFDVVVGIDVTTNRRKIKRNNQNSLEKLLQGYDKRDTIEPIENESDSLEKNSGEDVNEESVTSYLG